MLKITIGNTMHGFYAIQLSFFANQKRGMKWRALGYRTCLNSLGVFPNCFLNAVLKCFVFAKPL